MCLTCLIFAEGPKNENYQCNLVPDKKTRTDVDLGALGGPRKAVAEFVGNSLVTYLYKLDDDSVDVITTHTINPENPNVMIYSLKDVASDTSLIQTMNRQN